MSWGMFAVAVMGLRCRVSGGGMFAVAVQWDTY